MKNYLDLLQKIMDNGVDETNRTGIKRRSLFAQTLDFNLAEGFPALTTKKLLYKSVVAELIWFLKGSSNIENLDCKIWDSWADENGDVETSYGRFWKKFPRQTHTNRGEVSVTKDASEKPVNGMFSSGIDQIQYLRDSLKLLKEVPSHKSRTRLVCSAWHPDNAIASKLPPCHYTFVLNVQEDRLNLHWTQRSCDVPVGLPFNIASYATLLTMFALDAGFTPGLLSCSLVDAHIYHNQFEGVKTQLERTPKEPPSLIYAPKSGGIFHLPDLASFSLLGYNPEPFIKYEVAV